MYKTHQVLDNIRTFHIHAIRRGQLLAEMMHHNAAAANNIVCLVSSDSAQAARYYHLCCDHIEYELNKLERTSRGTAGTGAGAAGQATAGAATTSSTTEETSRPSTHGSALVSEKEEEEQLYLMDLNAYRPIQPLPRSHGISVIPLDVHSIDYHNLQAMHHGMTTIHFEEDTGRSAVVFLKLEESNSALAWCKPYWSTSLRSSGNTPQDYQLTADIEEKVLPGVVVKFEGKEATSIGLEDGFIDLMCLKEIIVGQSTADLALIARRHSLPEYMLAESGNCSIRLLFGSNLSDNRCTEFIAPKCIASTWVDGLRSVLQLIARQKKLCDQRVFWLKEKYLQLYYENGNCSGPTPAEAIRVFGGRKWRLEGMSAPSSSLPADSPSNRALTGNSSKLRKKKSTISLAVGNRDYSTRSQLSINSEPEAVLNSVRSSPQHSAYKATGRSAAGMTTRTTQTSAGGGGCGQQQQQERHDQQQQQYDSQSSLTSGKSSSSAEGRHGSLGGGGALFDSSPIHTSLLTYHYREKFCKRNTPIRLDSMGSNGSKQAAAVPLGSPRRALAGSSLQQTARQERMGTPLTHSSNIDFLEFSELFCSFLICIRRDIKDIFEQISSKSKFTSSCCAIPLTTFGPCRVGDIKSFREAETNYKEEKQAKEESKKAATTAEEKESSKFLGLLTRNTSTEQNEEEYSKSRIFDAIAASSIVTNSAEINTLKTSVLTITDFYAFITTYQCEDITLEQAKKLVELHEPNPVLRKRGCMSFEGFSRYLTDKNNFAYSPELSQTVEEDMDYPLSYYYIASSHNTYLTGHQLKGESSVELYSQVCLLSLFNSVVYGRLFLQSVTVLFCRYF